jgi:DNA-directed RNA polymerase subunit F
MAKHVPSMMEGLLDTNDKLMADNLVPSLIHATIISFGEVYIHPMVDGNGRIHRYLIHDIMKQREPMQHEFIIPISASILKNQDKYDKVLDSISKPLMAILDYELDEEKNNKIVIKNDIEYMYRYPDYTEHALFIYEMMQCAISNELIEEICLLVVFDFAKNAINSIVDIENRTLDKIVSILISQGGKFSKAKLKYITHFIDKNYLSTIENEISDLINSIKEKLEIDVVKVINKE